MKPIGVPPPRDMKNDQIKAEIYARAFEHERVHEMQTEQDTVKVSCCDTCGEPFQLGKGFVLGRDSEEVFRILCGHCFREFAQAFFEANRKEATP